MLPNKMKVLGILTLVFALNAQAETARSSLAVSNESLSKKPFNADLKLQMHQQMGQQQQSAALLSTELSHLITGTLAAGVQVQTNLALGKFKDADRNNNIEDVSLFLNDPQAHYDSARAVHFGYLAGMLLPTSSSSKATKLDFRASLGGSIGTLINSSHLSVASTFHLFNHSQEIVPLKAQNSANNQFAVENSVRVRSPLNAKLFWNNKVLIYTSKDQLGATLNQFAFETGLDYELAPAVSLETLIRSKDQITTNNSSLDRNHPSVRMGVAYQL